MSLPRQRRIDRLDAVDQHCRVDMRDRKSTRLNSSHGYISYAVFCLKKKKKQLGVAGTGTEERCKNGDAWKVVCLFMKWRDDTWVALKTPDGRVELQCASRTTCELSS